MFMMPIFFNIPIPDSYKMKTQIATANFGTMTIAQAINRMEAARPNLGGPSAINPGISAIQAWEIVRKALQQMRVEEEKQSTGTILDTKHHLAPWLEKRINQVCTNSINPDLDKLLQKMPNLMPDPEPEPPPRPKPRPFERKFS